MTLTLQHREDPLDTQVQNLYDYFRELRRRKDFREAVSGGVWFFQVKQSKNDGLWHPHLHALITGKYLPRRRLSRMWCQVSEGSEVIDIRTIYEPRSVANDVARYATSPANLQDVPPDDAIELVSALHGRRICGTWGTARGISMRPKKEKTPGKWISLGSWNTVVALYDSDQDARAIVLSWKTGIALTEGITCNHMDEAIDRMSTYDWEGLVDEPVQSHERSPPECLLF